jgi:hypothetical protein
MRTLKNYDALNRLTNIASVNPQGASFSSFAYVYNSANQRTRATMVDGSYWVWGYDSLGQVTSAKRYWNDGTPVAGQQFGKRGQASIFRISVDKAILTLAKFNHAAPSTPPVVGVKPYLGSFCGKTGSEQNGRI